MVVPRFVLQSTSAAADRFFDGCPGERRMTEFGASEVSSGITRMRRMGELVETRAGEAVNAFDMFRQYETTTVEVAPADYIIAHAYVRRYELKLRSPDALHLAVSQRLEVTLVTLDKRLVAAARALGAKVKHPS